MVHTSADVKVRGSFNAGKNQIYVGHSANALCDSTLKSVLAQSCNCGGTTSSASSRKGCLDGFAIAVEMPWLLRAFRSILFAWLFERNTNRKHITGCVWKCYGAATAAATLQVLVDSSATRLHSFLRILPASTQRAALARDWTRKLWIMFIRSTVGLYLVDPQSSDGRGTTAEDYVMCLRNGKQAYIGKANSTREKPNGSTRSGVADRLREHILAVQKREKSAHRYAQWAKHPLEELLRVPLWIGEQQEALEHESLSIRALDPNEQFWLHLCYRTCGIKLSPWPRFREQASAKHEIRLNICNRKRGMDAIYRLSVCVASLAWDTILGACKAVLGLSKKTVYGALFRPGFTGITLAYLATSHNIPHWRRVWRSGDPAKLCAELWHGSRKMPPMVGRRVRARIDRFILSGRLMGKHIHIRVAMHQRDAVQITKRDSAVERWSMRPLAWHDPSSVLCLRRSSVLSRLYLLRPVTWRMWENMKFSCRLIDTSSAVLLQVKLDTLYVWSMSFSLRSILRQA